MVAYALIESSQVIVRLHEFRISSNSLLIRLTGCPIVTGYLVDVPHVVMNIRSLRTESCGTFESGRGTLQITPLPIQDTEVVQCFDVLPLETKRLLEGGLSIAEPILSTPYRADEHVHCGMVLMRLQQLLR